MNINLLRPKRGRYPPTTSEYPQELNPANALDPYFSKHGASKGYNIGSNITLRVKYNINQAKNSKNIRHVFNLKNGLYTYVIYEHNNVTNVRYCSTASLEIGSKHFQICSSLPTNAKVLIAGELLKDGNKVTFNYESGTYSANILHTKTRSTIPQLNMFVKEVFLGLQNLTKIHSIPRRFFYEQLQGKQLIKTSRVLLNSRPTGKLKSSEIKKLTFGFNGLSPSNVNQRRTRQLFESYHKAGMSIENSAEAVKELAKLQRVAINQKNVPKRIRNKYNET